MLIDILKQRCLELKEEGRTEDSIIIALKEILQHYILNFIFTSKEYSHLTMYGGSILRIGYELPRMSEDLDFQTSKKINFEKFEKDIKKYFEDNYNMKTEIKSSIFTEKDTSVIFVKFDILKDFNLTKIAWTKLNIRIDINYFKHADKFINDTVPGGRGTDLAYTIKTYPLSTLMASKAVAFLKRDARGMGDVLTNVKPRDVYDMMWYMDRKVTPDLEYLKEKGLDFETFINFRDKVKLRANKIDDKVFRNDLSQFFYEKKELESWISNWREKFIQLLDSYKVYEITKLEKISFYTDLNTQNKIISFRFNTSNNPCENIIFKINLTNYWFVFDDIKISSSTNLALEEIGNKIEGENKKLSELDYNYISLFYNKIKNFLERNRSVCFQNKFETKLIMATADNLDPKKHIHLDRKLLEKIDFEELL